MADLEFLQRVKRLAIIGMFSDDTFLDRLVLKGGNLLDIVFEISTRSSIDVDFSMAGEFAEPINELRDKIDRALSRVFAEQGLHVFDVKVEARPRQLTPDRKDFWGGYDVEFKVIEIVKYRRFKDDLDSLRRNSLNVGRRESTRFTIDISKHEYCETKAPSLVDSYRVFTYTPEMVVCEKLRAICQQMPAYVAIVGSHPSARARDFVDIHVVAEKFCIDFSDESLHELLRKTFEVKRVPLSLLGEIAEFREFHAGDFVAVKDTVKPGVELKEYGFYFDYVRARCGELKPLWHE